MLLPSLIEDQVTKIWKSVLEMPDGHCDRTFFELQGQSISAMRIVARVEDELGVAMDFAVLFDDPDLPTFVAAVIEAARAAGRIGSDSTGG
ncbi:phosphopantetheine-binding protein [Actinoalloteichus fjordicus]|nr:phosphopantetheine-binding protein [Actinoalloteichus fjordicus]